MPETGVGAALLNITIVDPTDAGFVTVFPSDVEQPNASSLNHRAGQVVANQVLVGLSTAGDVNVFHQANAHLIVDVVGWVDADAEAPALVPARLLDTRVGASTIDGALAGIGRVGAGRSVPIDVLGRGGVPATGVSAVMVSVTAVEPSADGYLTVHPDGTDRPTASNLNYRPGDVVANQVLARLGSNGRFQLFTSAESHLIVDVIGWLPEGSDVASMTPARLTDTRSGTTTVDGVEQGVGMLRGGTAIDVQVGGRAGVPVAAAGSVMLNVTAVDPSAAGYLTVFPGQDELPNASTINFDRGQVVANQVLVTLGALRHYSSLQPCRHPSDRRHRGVASTGRQPTAAKRRSAHRVRSRDNAALGRPRNRWCVVFDAR